MDLSVEYRNIQDEPRVNRDGTVTPYKRYDFYIGKFGPFVERVPLDNFDPSEITRRVETMKRHLQGLPT